MPISSPLTRDFDYFLPPELIAQHPLPNRDESRLLRIDRRTSLISHGRFSDIVHCLSPGDLLVVNDSRVIPARLRARIRGRLGAVELLLIQETSPLEWWALARPGRKLSIGNELEFPTDSEWNNRVTAVVLAKNSEGHCLFRFNLRPPGSDPSVDSTAMRRLTPLSTSSSNILCDSYAPDTWVRSAAPNNPSQHRTPTQDTQPPDPAPFAQSTPEPTTGFTEAREQFQSFLHCAGEIPLPPYIQRPSGPDSEDARRYQTVYSITPGSVAAPTAGLHFTSRLLRLLHDQGVRIEPVTLHVSYGTFAPVKSEALAEHQMHEEHYEIPSQTSEAIARTKANGHRVIAVGTTTCRVLESAAREGSHSIDSNPRIRPVKGGRTRLFLYPPADFHVVDGLLTNFHLPRSTLLMLVSAFAAPGATNGREIVLNAYAEAIQNGYRFYSYGDAMLII